MGLGELEAGDTLLSRYGLVTVAQVTSHPAAPVYNISVQQQHVYEVTEWGILTHNTCFWVSPSADGGFDVLRDGKVIKTFKTGDAIADQAAANAYRRKVQKIAEKGEDLKGEALAERYNILKQKVFSGEQLALAQHFQTSTTQLLRR